MIPSRVLQAQLELSSHRLWLTSFLSHTRPLSQPCRSSSTESLNRRVLRPSPIQPCRHGSVQARARTGLKPRQRLTGIRTPLNVEVKGSLLSELRQAIDKENIETVFQLYSGLEDKTIITSSHCLKLAQFIHHSIRNTDHIKDPQVLRAYKESLHSFAETLIEDIKRGALAPHRVAHIHLLGFFKECGVRDVGIRFWKWLEGHDELYVDADVYGAAIELLTVNGSPLVEMEELFRQALVRFPGLFMDYHLSPNGIVPDREQSTTLKGVPMGLLQGIVTARLLSGDVRGAYLDLDTALRLYPDQVPNRFFRIFINERPVLESYSVFATACRAGTPLPSVVCKQLFAALRTSADLTSPVRHAFTVRAMLYSLYAYMCAGGQIPSNLVNELVITLTQYLRLKGVASLEMKQKQKLANEVMDTIRMSLTIFAHRGAKPGLSAFNSIITNLGGYGQSKQIIGIALTDALTLGLQPSAVTHRSIVTAAGTLRDGDFVKKAWSNLLEGREDAGQNPEPIDFHVLVKNAAAVGLTDYARQEFARLREKLPNAARESISVALENTDRKEAVRGTETVGLSTLLGEIQKIRVDLEVMENFTKSMSQVQDLRDGPFPITLVPGEDILPETEMRKLYDELTTEPHSTPTLQTHHPMSAAGESPESRPPLDNAFEPTRRAVSLTNIPFGTLRYENWKTINHLLAQAEKSDNAYVDAVDRAIAAGEIPPRRPVGLPVAADDEVASFGLSDMMSASQRKGKADSEMMDPARIQAGRERILKLRGLDLS